MVANMTVEETKELLAWLHERGAMQVAVGDIKVVFGPRPVQRPAVTQEFAKANPLGAPYGVTDEILLRST